MPFKRFSEAKSAFGVLQIFLLAGLLFLMWKRLYYGVDFSDESLYSALPLSFLRGHRPYVDELLFVQNIGIFLLPLVWLHRLFEPGSEGLVLFFRQSFLVLGFLSFFGVYSFARNYVSRWIAIWAGMVVFCFVPFAIPSLSYNTVSKILHLNGVLFISMTFMRSKQSHWYFPVGALLCCLGGLIYPTTSIFAFSVICWGSWRSYKTNRWNAANLTAIFILMLTAVVGVSSLASVGGEQIRVMLDYTTSMDAHSAGFAKLCMIWEQIFRMMVFYIPFGLFIFLTPLLLRLRFGFLAGILALLLYCYKFALVDGLINHHFFAALGIFGGYLFWVAKDRFSAEEYVSLKFVYLSSLVLSIFVMWTSGNGFISFCMGASGCVLVTVIATARISTSRESAVGLGFAAVAFALCGVFWMQHYGDEDLQELSTQVQQGPYRGLWTTPEKNKFVSDLYVDLNRAEMQNLQTIAAYDHATNVYLSSPLRPLAATVWTYFPSHIQSNQAILANYYNKNNLFPDVVVWYKALPHVSSVTYVRINNEENGILFKTLISANMEKIVSRPWYDIYIKNK